MENIIISVFPILLLIWMMTKKNAYPSYIALPATAVLVGILQLFYFDANPILVGANVITGALSAITPVSIIAGAILLNRVNEISGAQAITSRWLETINKNKIAQLMIIGWAFAFMLEGASGFGTPAAIAAPILMGLGFNPLKVAMLALVMNSVPVSFGAVGTPTWFGFGNLGLNDQALLDVGRTTALIHTIAATIIPLLALRFLMSWRAIRKNIIYIQLSIFSCTLPYLILAQWNYEFPALVGGAIGFVLSIILANYNIGLSNNDEESNPTDSQLVEKSKVPFTHVVKAMTPTILLIAILVLTRIKQLGIKGLLNDATQLFSFDFGSFGHLSVSRALIIKFSDIFGTHAAWAYKTLYVPAIIPFLVVSIISIIIFKMPSKDAKRAFTETASGIKLPFIALIGALIMVKFMMLGGEHSPIMTVGTAFADVMGKNWQYVASYLGAVGAFFSGSATVSNLTFGAIQNTIATTVGLPTHLVLALQSVGGAMGNMVCLNNIIAVSTILGIKNQEGYIIKRTVKPMIVYGVIAAIVSAFL
ncbi:L-lactate permease [Vibrio sp. SS-MA-C1-2]|uniref:L-lactate permease n=1 Tax=Vibrio sp. SS-MA-C1-2 TaxID=2908646 RepID=UPI001F2BB25F|nr:L-lactate permease [Vibrio sp. SS-MA-C1-2]UJF18181.1 L-lactate permease [Vibrio sp. SS-MA-C1-2]